MLTLTGVLGMKGVGISWMGAPALLIGVGVVGGVGG